MKALYGECCLLCDFLLYATVMLAGLLASWKKSPRLGLLQVNAVKKKCVLAVGTMYLDSTG